MQDMVSIISPCYNGEKYLKPFLDSVLQQTYHAVELIVVNDGSTDGTGEILEEYRERFEGRGYTYITLYQENAGQAAAINRGLALFTGEYLAWIDSDDVMMPENIAEKVTFLKQNPEFGFVLSQGLVVSSEDYDKPIGLIKRSRPEGEDTLFEDLLQERNVVFCPGVIMARRDALLKAVPTKHIYESREGQNWQLMLPLAYLFSCGYIDKPLFKCVAHPDSHSRQEKSYEQQLERMDNFVDLLTNTIQSIPQMPEAEQSAWISMVQGKYAHRKLQFHYRHCRWDRASKEIRGLKQLGEYSVKDGYACFLVRMGYAGAKKIAKRILRWQARKDLKE